MKISGLYSFKSARDFIESKYAGELQEIEQIIAAIDLARIRDRKRDVNSAKNTYDPRLLRKIFQQEFSKRYWFTQQIPCEYSTAFYTQGYRSSAKTAFREMDWVKNQLGTKLLLGQYGSVVYDICAEMTIFHKANLINAGIGIVPLKDFADDMSTGVSYFEQFVWDLEHRGISNIDIPVLILGITA